MGRSVQQRTTMLWIVASLLAGVRLRDHERSGWFILLATAGVAAFSLGRPLDALYIIATSTVETGRTVYAVAALACYLPLQVWLVLSAARDARGRRQAWALAATAAVIIGMLPVVGIQWVLTLYSLAALGSSALLTWSTVTFTSFFWPHCTVYVLSNQTS